MQAIAARHFGGPEVLVRQEVPRPRVGKRDVLLRVRAAGVNPIDWRIRSGSLRWILPIKRPWIPGYDVSGEVEEVGADVTRFRPGDAVFCFLDRRQGGGYAEFAAASEGVVVEKPPNISHVQAAGVPLAALTALQSLRDFGRIAPGARVLVNGAAGGVGIFAIQIAKAFDAQVTGVCSERNLALVAELGADRMIDYGQTDFTREDVQYDIVFDAVAKSHFSACRRVLSRRGVYVRTVPTASSVFNQATTKLFRGQRCYNMLARPRGADLRQVAQWIGQDRVRPIVDRVYSWDEAAEAHRASEAGHACGKLVLRIAES